MLQRIWRGILVAAVALGGGSWITAVTLAQSSGGGPGIAGTVYVDPQYHFGVQFLSGTGDPNNGQITPIYGDGNVQIGASLDGDLYSVGVEADKAATADDCVSAFTDLLRSVGKVTDATDLAVPSSDAESTALVRFATTSSSGKPVAKVDYIECRAMMSGGKPVDGVFLTVYLVADEANYPAALTASQPMLDSLRFDADPSDFGNQGAPTESGVTGSTYTSVLGYSLMWDGRLFTPELARFNELDGGVTLTGDGAAILVEAFASRSPTDCARQERAAVMKTYLMQKRSPADSEVALERASDGDAVFDQGDLTFPDGSTAAGYLYVECRPLGYAIAGEPMMVSLSVAVSTDSYSRMKSALQSVLDSLAVRTDPNTSGALGNAAGSMMASPVAGSGVSGTTYVSAASGFSISWDGSDFTPELITEDNPDNGIRLTNGDTSIMVFPMHPVDSGVCVTQIQIDLEHAYGTLQRRSLDTTFKPAINTAYSLYEARIPTASGPATDSFIYLRCYYVGPIAVEVIVPDVDYNNEFDSIQAVLDTVAITG